MADELIDICDKNNNHINIQKMKSEAHKDGLWHRASHIWIYNSNGEILLQLRAKEKELYPDMWDISAAGHVSAGEEPIVSGLREVKEELGLKGQIDDFIGCYSFFEMNQLILAYHVYVEGEIVLGKELAEFKMVPPEKLRPWAFGTGYAVKDWLEKRKSRLAED